MPHDFVTITTCNVTRPPFLDVLCVIFYFENFAVKEAIGNDEFRPNGSQKMLT